MRDQSVARAGPRRVRDRHRLPPRGPDDRGDRQPQPGLDLRNQHPRDLDAARGLPPQPARRSRSCSPRPTRPTASRRSCRTTRTTPLAGQAPLRRQQVLHRPHRTVLRRHLRPAGGDHALRQLLRRRRPELEPHRARHDPLGAARPAAGDPLRRQLVRDYFYVEDGAAAYMLLAERLAADPTRRGEAFNFSNETHDDRARARRADPAADGTPTSSRTFATRQPTRSAPVPRAPRRPAGRSAGAALHLDEGCERTIAWYRELLERPRDAADACRSCGGGELEPVLSLGEPPLANALLTPDQLDEPEPTLPARARLLPGCSPGPDHRDGAARGAVPRLPLLLVVLRHDAHHARSSSTSSSPSGALGPRASSSRSASNDGYLLQHYASAASRCSASSRPATSRRSPQERGIATLAGSSAPSSRRDSAEGARRRHPRQQRARPRRRTSTASSPASSRCSTTTAWPSSRCRTSRTCSTAASSTRSTTSTSVTSRSPRWTRSSPARARGRGRRAPADPRRLAAPPRRPRRRTIRRRGVNALLAEEARLGRDGPRVLPGRSRDRVGSSRRDLVALLERSRPGADRRVRRGGKGQHAPQHFGIETETLDFVVDRSPHKQGRYIPG